MGVKIDLEKNKVRGEEAIISADDSKVTVAVIPTEEMNNKIHGDEAIISTPESKVKVVIIPTDEELMIASDTQAILNK